MTSGPEIKNKRKPENPSGFLIAEIHCTTSRRALGVEGQRAEKYLLVRVVGTLLTYGAAYFLRRIPDVGRIV